MKHFPLVGLVYMFVIAAKLPFANISVVCAIMASVIGLLIYVTSKSSTLSKAMFFTLLGMGMLILIQCTVILAYDILVKGGAL